MEELTLIIQDAERRKERLALRQYIKDQKSKRRAIKQIKRQIIALSTLLVIILIVLKISL